MTLHRSLIVLDSVHALRLRLLLEEVGMEARIAAGNAELHLVVAAGFLPHLVLLDHDRPTREGLHQLATLRKLGVDAPVLWVSADAEPEAVKHQKDNTAQGLLRVDASPRVAGSVVQALLSDGNFCQRVDTLPATPGAKAMAETLQVDRFGPLPQLDSYLPGC